MPYPQINQIGTAIPIKVGTTAAKKKILEAFLLIGASSSLVNSYNSLKPHLLHVMIFKSEVTVEVTPRVLICLGGFQSATPHFGQLPIALAMQVVL
tara:strand:- start:408 stop:695 length:288 start_codon:yes stop_codon:yes gene_type:complete